MVRAIAIRAFFDIILYRYLAHTTSYYTQILVENKEKIMSQVGAIVISDNVNTKAMIELLKDDKKITIGSEQVTENGVRYIPIDKKA